MFNPFPVDVLVKYKETSNYDSNIYESGWNIFSAEFVSQYLAKNSKVQLLTFEKFDISIDLLPQVDPIRSWTLRDYKESRFIVNALRMIQPQYLLEIHL